MTDIGIHNCTNLKTGLHMPENGNLLQIAVHANVSGFDRDGSYQTGIKQIHIISLYDLPTAVTDALIKALGEADTPERTGT